MADTARRIAGFNELSQGINNGVAADLVPPNQAWQAVNVSFRGNVPETRPPWMNHPITNVPPTWSGIFQGSAHYDGQSGPSGWLVARGGRFFFLTDDNFTLTDITTQVALVNNAAFTQPGVGNNVTVTFNYTPPVNVGDTVMFGLVHYIVQPLVGAGPLQLLLQQVDPGGGVVPIGTGLTNNAGVQYISIAVYPPNKDFVFIFQAENYLIVLGGQEATMIYDGSTLRLSGPDEVPSGFLGAYGWGRIWICNPDRRTFEAGDIVYGPSGTAMFGFRDAILKFTENDFLNEGGSFGVPYEAGPITSMQFLVATDTSLGLGQLLVGTTNMVFSVNAPVERTTWKSLTYPIQTISIIDYGPRGPRHTISINGDMWYRAEDGIRSFISSVRNFPSPGNTPMSREVDPILFEDTPQLLFYGSAMLFDNKMFMTVSPFRDFSQQVNHRGLIVINFDVLSNLRVKETPIWEGLQTGLNILQLSKARIQGEERGFIWAQGQDIELWEVLTDGISDQFVTSNGTVNIRRTDIACILQTRSEDYSSAMDLKRLIMGEIYLEDVADMVVMQISYRPDDYPNWVPWQQFAVCSTVSQCYPHPPGVCLFQTNARSYAARLTLPQPRDDCNLMTGKPMREFHKCQFQLLWTGHARVHKFFTHTKLQTQNTEGWCPPKVTCVLFPVCEQSLFIYDSHGGQGILGEGGEFILGEGGGILLPE
jgi:hypothetical protein